MVTGVQTCALPISRDAALGRNLSSCHLQAARQSQAPFARDRLNLFDSLDDQSFAKEANAHLRLVVDLTTRYRDDVGEGTGCTFEDLVASLGDDIDSTAPENLLGHSVIFSDHSR